MSKVFYTIGIVLLYLTTVSALITTAFFLFDVEALNSGQRTGSATIIKIEPEYVSRRTVVTYTYTVDGKTYTSTDARLSRTVYNQSDVGTKIPIRYDSDNPGNSTIKSTNEDMFLIYIGHFIALSLAYALIDQYKHYTHRIASKYPWTKWFIPSSMH